MSGGYFTTTALCLLLGAKFGLAIPRALSFIMSTFLDERVSS